MQTFYFSRDRLYGRNVFLSRNHKSTIFSMSISENAVIEHLTFTVLKFVRNSELA